MWKERIHPASCPWRITVDGLQYEWRFLRQDSGRTETHSGEVRGTGKRCGIARCSTDRHSGACWADHGRFGSGGGAALLGKIAKEAGTYVAIGIVGTHNFQCNLLLVFSVSANGAINCAHAAKGQFFEDFVRTNALAG